MESIISTFHIDWKIIVAQAVNFGVVFAVLYWFALKPLSKLMAERSEKIQKGLQDSKRSQELLEQAAKEYEQNSIKLKQMAVESQKELQKDLQKLRDENIEMIKADTEEWKKKRTEQMQADKKTLVNDAAKEIFSLAAAIASKVTGENAERFEKAILDEMKKM